MAIQVVILAAGQGKRMHSSLPKVLHRLGGKPLLVHVTETAHSLFPDTQPLVVYGHQGSLVREALSELPVKWVEQKEQLGTGHALMQALPHIAETDQVLVLYGDVPLTSAATLQRLLAMTPAKDIGMLTAKLVNPQGYGRIKRDKQQRVIGVVEEKDATVAERALTEINPGIYLAPASQLKKWLPALENKNAQGEYYLTDIISLAILENIPVHDAEPLCEEEILGVNDCLQLAQLERFYQRQQADLLMRQGVTLYDPNRLDVRGELQVGRDVILDVNVIIEGKVVIGNQCVIGPNTLLRNAVIGDGVEIRANSVIDGAKIGSHCIIGPFARLRPDTVLAEQVHIGNFVEIKKTTLGVGSKVNHLSYIGDSEVGKEVNIGAGTITCNYDGVNKHKTIIGDGAFIGSCTQLVAPVKIGDHATIGAGSTITKDAPANELTLARSPQQTIKEWQRPQKTLPETADYKK